MKKSKMRILFALKLMILRKSKRFKNYSLWTRHRLYVRDVTNFRAIFFHANESINASKMVSEFVKAACKNWDMTWSINHYALTIRKWQKKIRDFIKLRNFRRAFMFNALIFEFRKYKNELNISGNDEKMNKLMDVMDWKLTD